MRCIVPVLLLALAAPAARALDGAVIGPSAFESLTTGRTLSFGLEGTHYGAEQYLPGREVIWRLGDGACISGSWFARGEDICFVYDALSGEQCWRFTRRAGRVRASSLGGALELDVTGSSDAPIACPAPDTGV